MVVRPTVGLERVRIRLSNAFGTTPLRIGAAHIALAAQQSAIVPRSDYALTFGGRTSVSIPAGAPILSDPIDLKLQAFTEVAISLYLPEKASDDIFRANRRDRCVRRFDYGRRWSEAG